MNESKRPRVAIYARVSTSDKDQNPETQLAPLREFVTNQRWMTVGEYVDQTSATDLKGRVAWSQLLDDASKRKMDLVLVWRIDRAFRSVLEGDWTGADDRGIHGVDEKGGGARCELLRYRLDHGKGHSEGLLGRLVRDAPTKKLFVASKVPPENFRWLARAGSALEETYPADHIRAYTAKSLHNLGLDAIDLMQFHVWHDDWALPPVPRTQHCGHRPGALR